ncbi:MAG: hypothetical protein ACREBQ_02310, partial [Nitrososphaerales archaeon]
IMDLSIGVNMSISEVSNNASEWIFQPNIQISGAKYTLTTSADSSLYVIQTGVQFSTSPWNALTIGLVSAVVIVACVASFYELRRHRRRKEMGAEVNSTISICCWRN